MNTSMERNNEFIDPNRGLLETPQKLRTAVEN